MTNQASYQLFVYGSLRSGFRSPAFEYMSRYFTFVANAKVKGKLFDLGDYPGGVPTEEDAYIVGELYTVKNESEFSYVIGQLDDYEGLTVEAGETQLYRRELAEVYFADQATKAWIYWYNGDTDNRPVIESGDLMQYMQEKNKQ